MKTLVLIDVQNDFLPGGALEVPGSDAIVPILNRLQPAFDLVVAAQDWHPAGHASFATSHDGAAPFSTTELSYGTQTLWPDHCVQGTHGAAFVVDLEVAGIVDQACSIVRKGMNPDVDSYSAFFENDQVTATGLAGYLRDRGVERVFLAGLAYDFCVGYSALDARKEGFEAVVVKDLCRAIGMPLEQGTTVDAIEAAFTQAGVELAESRPRARFAPR